MQQFVRAFAVASLCATGILLVDSPRLSAAGDDGQRLLTVEHYVPVVTKVPTIAGQTTQIYVREKVKAGTALRGPVPASKVVKRAGAKTAEGERVEFSLKGKKVFVNDARVITPDIRASNGIVHAINGVLIPPDL